MTTKNLRKSLLTTLGPESFGGFLRGARASQDLTQVEMAKKLKISKSTLCDIEKGRQHVSPSLASKIAKKLRFSEKIAVQLEEKGNALYKKMLKTADLKEKNQKTNIYQLGSRLWS